MKNFLLKVLTLAVLVTATNSCTKKDTDTVRPNPTISPAPSSELGIGSLKMKETHVGDVNSSIASEESVAGFCDFPVLAQDNNWSSTSPNSSSLYQRGNKYYIAGQKVYLKYNTILTTGCDSHSYFDIVLYKANVIVSILKAQAPVQTYYEITLPNNLATSRDYKIGFAYQGSYGPAPDPITIYADGYSFDTPTSSLVISPNGIYTQQNSSPVTVQWDTNVFQPSEPLSIYLYGDGSYNKGQRTLIASNVLNSQGSVTFSPPYNATQDSGPSLRWRIRVQKSSDDTQGGNSTDNFGY